MGKIQSTTSKRPTKSLIKKGARVDSGVASSALNKFDSKIISSASKRKVGGL